MKEHIITIKGRDIIGIMFLQEIDLGYIERKVVVYCKDEDIVVYKRLEQRLGTGRVNIREIRKNLALDLKTHLKSDDVKISEPILFISGNKNTSERNKRLLESLGVQKSFERTVLYLGEKSFRHLRKRPKRTEHKFNVHEK